MIQNWWSIFHNRINFNTHNTGYGPEQFNIHEYECTHVS